MIYTCIYLTAWLLCNTFLFALAIHSDVNGGVYVAILLFALMSTMIRKIGGAEDA